MNLHEAIEFTKANRESWSDGKGAKTAHINARHVERVLGPDLPVEDIKTHHFHLLSKELLAEGKSKGTVNRITAALSTVLTELRQNGLDAPRVEYKRQKESKGRQGYYTEQEVQRLLAFAWLNPDYFLLHDSILFSIKTGCRQGELLRLSFDDIDLVSRTITFRDTKNGTDHTIALHEDLVPVVERRIEAAIDSIVFPWRDKDQLLRALRRLQDTAGVSRDRCWHSLRHSTATWLLERNVPIRAVMGVLNHSNISTTLRYGKSTERSIAEAIQSI